MVDQVVKGRLGSDEPTALAPPSGVEPASGLQQSRSSTDAANALLALASKVETSAGPDRDMDVLIWWAVDKASFSCRYWQGALGLPRELTEMPSLDGIGGMSVRVSAPRFTASLDAATVLIPSLPDAGTFSVIRRVKGEPCSADIDFTWYGNGATPAIALATAALRARAATAGETEGLDERSEQSPVGASRDAHPGAGQ